ncbi:MAG TPA: RNA polymerase sigma factor [Burkholderiales bacterium]|nr:RNA polymerase sigma factor [Burkholderiales bacterium]
MKPALSISNCAELSDPELARRIAGGDNPAFEVLMRRHNRALFRTARAILRDDAEAEDALQEAYFKAYRTIGGFRGEARLSTWLGRIVANEALMRLRKRTRRSEIVPLHSSATDEDLNQISDTTMHQGPEISAQRAEMRKLIETQIDALPEAYRPVFMLRAVEEFSVEETADILQIPAATVRSRFFRARSLLREALAREIDVACDDAFAFAGERCDRIVAGVMARIGRLAGEPR